MGLSVRELYDVAAARLLYSCLCWRHAPSPQTNLQRQSSSNLQHNNNISWHQKCTLISSDASPSATTRRLCNKTNAT